MSKFQVFAEEARSFVVEVEAESLDEAIEMVDQDPGKFIPDSEHGDYIDGSFTVNVDFTRQHHDFLEEERCSSLTKTEIK